MKNKIFSLAITIFMAGAIFTSCQSPAKKLEDAQDKVQEAKNDAVLAQWNLDKIHQDSINERQKFKHEAEEKISDHEKNIAEFKARIASEKSKNKIQYEKKLALLEQQNTDLKKKLEDYKEEGKDKWETFKTEISNSMDELGQAFKDLTVSKSK